MNTAEGNFHQEYRETVSEKVIPALKYRNEIFTGIHHGDAMNKLEEKYPVGRTENVITGFLTTSGEFITDRKKALEIADRSGQTRPGKSLSKMTGKLHSEDVKL